MSTALLNEVLQWMGIVGVLLLTLAVYRQLGAQGGGHVNHEHSAASTGPALGARANEELLQLFSGRPSGWKLAVFVDETCTACEDMLTQLEAWHKEGTAGFDLALLAEGGQTYVRGLSSRFPWAAVRSTQDIVGEDESPGNFPFAILLSQDGVIREKVVGSMNAPFLLERIKAEQQARVRG